MSGLGAIFASPTLGSQGPQRTQATPPPPHAEVSHNTHSLQYSPIAASHPGAADVSYAQQQQQHQYPSQVQYQQSQVDTEQVAHLMGIVDQSQKYGRQIEQSVEELAGLLHKKTVECEGLRAIAEQKDDGLRQAVKTEYENRIKSESRQLQEIRGLQVKIDKLQVDKVQLQQEVESLRSVVSELKAVPPPTGYTEDDNSLFNRVLRGPSEVDDDRERQQKYSDRERQNAKDEVFATWKLPKANTLTTHQRSLVHFVANMSQDDARALQSSGVFDFLKVTCQRICTPLPDGTFNDLSSVVGDIIRERRISDGDLSAMAAEPINTVTPNDRQRVMDLFLANNPGNYAELQRLLTQHAGKEDQLYAQLKREYETIPIGGSTGNAVRAPMQSQTQAATTPVEMHARVILMYKKYNPEKLNSPELNQLLSKYPPEVLLASLVAKYGPEPTAAERRELVKLICEN